MAKRAYIGVNGAARKVKKGYVGIDSVARKIKKAYIGIGGVARPCFGHGEVVYYGEITPTIDGNYEHGGGFNGVYAVVVAGGANAYNKNLTRTTAAAPSKLGFSSGGAGVGSYALLAGGMNNTVVYAYNQSLVQSNPTALSAARYGFAEVSGHHAMFAGGYVGGYVSSADVYSKSLVRTTTSISVAVNGNAGAATSDYLFVGGGFLSNRTKATAVDAFNSNMTRTSAPALTVARTNLAAAGSDDYVLFAGGWIWDSPYTTYATVDGYDNNLTRISVQALSARMERLSGAGLKGHFLFGLGHNTSGDVPGVDVYDPDLTRTATLSIKKPRRYGVGIGMEDFALFCNGTSDDVEYCNNVDAFKIV